MHNGSADHELVFVHGLLKAGCPNHAGLQGARPLGRRCLIGGRLYDLGAFPLAVLAPGGTDVLHGELYAVPPEGLDRLDRLEGHPSSCDRSRHRLSDGTEAWVYHGQRGQVERALRIPHGDWGTTPVLHYGSNLDPGRLAGRCPGWDGQGLVVALEGWSWAIDKLGRDGSGKAGIRVRPGSTTWGIVTHLCPHDIVQLDGCEGVPGGHYVRTAVPVRSRCGAVFEALTYAPGDPFRRPGLVADAAYRHHILTGLDHWELPDAWRRTVDASLRTTA